MTTKGSPPLKLEKYDWQKIGKGAAIALAAAAASYLAVTVVPQFSEDDTATGIVLTAVLGVAINMLRKFVTDTQEPK